MAQVLCGLPIAAPTSSSKNSTKVKGDHLAEWKKLKFDANFPAKLAQRADLLHDLVNENSITRSVNGHSMRVMKRAVNVPGAATVMALLTPQEIQAFLGKERISVRYMGMKCSH